MMIVKWISKALSRIFLMGGLIVLLVGCNENAGVTLHEPGVYKGKVDRHETTAEERAEILSKRIQRGQIDR